MYLGDGRYLVAELPLEHLAIYADHHKLGVYYHKGTACECCEDVGIHLVVTESKDGKDRSINLYTGEWIQMTVDHILAKAKGGKNKIENYQPLCRWCNSIKADHDWTIEQLRAIIKHRYKNVL